VARKRIEANWHSRKGTKTADNRDHAGLGVSTSGVMSIVVDGSTAGPDNGEYAGAIVREMVDWFIVSVSKRRTFLFTEGKMGREADYPISFLCALTFYDDLPALS
jgi:hypothetical protein